ncbi:AFR482Wp [Eremothecium gossypii ATCC 10895]|uniref:Inositol oxygenase n=1 Tax=Eremothecium gossypii (strain ATCC 10895 / CBS 109.51 / FGSC 9923 / NRRL Y-1056) TaxID=284811 RepID=Q752U1_EREGS|nr:AFR482Wp [Eremothecium gossypii ATCC 10895]AAS53853.1 AFR482Wp [Eremothecium gossypii ATCC 10895]AEY98166.1 FAFR482Wp [Eremothecium gossypii FDAG1]
MFNSKAAGVAVSASGHIHTDQGHILEQIDEDVQSVNAFKTRLKNSAHGSGVAETAGDAPAGTEEAAETECDTGNEEGQPASKRRKLLRPETEKPISEEDYRQYHQARQRVKDFYKEQHENQTVAFNLQARINYKTKVRAKMSIWEALCKLSKLIDESDPDTELSQIDHALQTAEAIRAEGRPRWMQLVGLIHDLGKILYFFDSEGQWDVVGDTFPVGCQFAEEIIFHEFFEGNADKNHPIYSQKLGIYHENCGLASVMLSWGHDEYMYYIAKGQSLLNDKALAMIRYHSFYPWHREGAYRYLMDESDYELLEAVQDFNKYDLYSKTNKKYDVGELKEYYQDLINEFFPTKLVEF